MPEQSETPAARGKRRRGEIPVDELPLEKCFEELNLIVEALEKESVSLDESIRLFERGMALSRRCMRELTSIERRIEKILEDEEGNVKEVPFDVSEEESETGDT
jgi:exodeoxyribonuclease VII small subunit